MKHPLPVLSIVSLFALTHAAFAAPKVVLFGAEASSQRGMDSCGGNIRNIPWANGRQMVDVIAREINANPSQEWVIAGHSSASVNAEHVALKVKNPNQIKLVLLDGYGHNGVQEKVDTTCWYGVNSRGGLSLNASTMKSVCTRARSHLKAYTAPQCGGQWCSHFSLVNKNAPADLVTNNWGSRGYENCRANTAWIP